MEQNKITKWFKPISNLEKSFKKLSTHDHTTGDEYQCPTQNSITTIAKYSPMDVNRSAVNCSNYASLKGSASSRLKRKRNDKDERALTNIPRTLSVLDGVGRVLYPKRIKLQPFLKFEHTLESMVDQFPSTPTLFTSFLHENYLKYFGDLKDVSEAVEYLSSAELLLTDKDGSVRKCGLLTAMKGLMAANRNPVLSPDPVHLPRQLKYTTVDQYYENRRVNPLDACYYDIIKPSGYVSNGSRFLRN